MPGQSKLPVEIGIEDAEQKLDALIAKAKQFTEELRKSGGILGTPGGQTAAGSTFAGSPMAPGAAGTAAGIRNSATTGGVAGAQALATAAGLAWGGLSQEIQSSFMAAAGVTATGGVTAFDPKSPLLGRPSSAQVYGAGGYSLGGSGGAGGGAYFPPGNNGGFGPFQPPAPWSNPMSMQGFYAGLSRNDQQFARQRNLMFGTAGAIGVSALTGAGNLYAQQTVSGDYDPMAGAGLWGQSTGAIAGAAVGALFSPTAPGTGAATGAIAGGILGSASAQAAIAPAVRDAHARLILQSIIARSGTGDNLLNAGSERLSVTGSGSEVAGRAADGTLKSMAELVTGRGKSVEQMAMIRAGVYVGNDIMSSQQAASIYSTIGSAELAAGIPSTQAGLLSNVFNLGSRYGGAGGARMAGLAAPAIAAQNRMGGNLTDILMSVGPESYGAMQDAYGRSDLTRGQLAGYGATQSAGHAAQVASMQIRGSGSATAGALNSALESLAGLPGGKDSLAYAQTRKGYTDALYSSYEQADAAGYELASTRLAGREARAQLLPFAPANMLGLGVERLGINRQQIRTIQGRLTSLRASGNLSEDQELRMTSQIEQLRTQDAGVVSQLSEGMENRLPALSAGAPSFHTALTSVNLAALNLSMMHSPIRRYGAQGGGQLHNQRQFIADMGGNESDVRPRSQTQALNTDLGALVPVLSKLASVLDKMSTNVPNPMRPTEISGSNYGYQDRARLNTEGVYGRSN